MSASRAKAAVVVAAAMIVALCALTNVARAGDCNDPACLPPPTTTPPTPPTTAPPTPTTNPGPTVPTTNPGPTVPTTLAADPPGPGIQEVDGGGTSDPLVGQTLINRVAQPGDPGTGEADANPDDPLGTTDKEVCPKKRPKPVMASTTPTRAGFPLWAVAGLAFLGALGILYWILISRKKRKGDEADGNPATEVTEEVPVV